MSNNWWTKILGFASLYIVLINLKNYYDKFMYITAISFIFIPNEEVVDVCTVDDSADCTTQ